MKSGQVVAGPKTKTHTMSRVDTADRLFDTVEKQLLKSPPHQVRLMMSNYFTPMFKKIKLLQPQPVHDPDDVIEKIEF